MRRLALVLGLSVLGSLLALPACAAANPLIGSWKWDNNKTLQELKMPTEGSDQLKSDAARAKRFVEGEIRNLNSNMTLTYTDKEYVEVIVDGHGAVLSKTSSPYKVVEIGKGYVIIDQMKNWGSPNSSWKATPSTLR